MVTLGCAFPLEANSFKSQLDSALAVNGSEGLIRNGLGFIAKRTAKATFCFPHLIEWWMGRCNIAAATLWTTSAILESISWCPVFSKVKNQLLKQVLIVRIWWLGFWKSTRRLDTFDDRGLTLPRSHLWDWPPMRRETSRQSFEETRFSWATLPITR